MKSHDFRYVDELIGKGLKQVVLDIDNTITRSTVTDLFFWLKKKQYNSALLYKVWKIIFYVVWAPYYLWLDRKDRGAFQAAFMKRYREFTSDEILLNGKDLFENQLVHRFIDYTHDLIPYLKNKGLKVQLLSTNLDVIAQQYAKYFGVTAIGVPTEIIMSQSPPTKEYFNTFKHIKITSMNNKCTLSIADSIHDEPMFENTEFALIVTKKEQNWMYKYQGEILIRQGQNIINFIKIPR